MGDAAGVDRARRIGEEMFGASARVQEDDSTIAFAIPAGADSGPPIAWLESGWSYLEHLDPPGAGDRRLRWRWMNERARIAVLASAPTPVRFRITAQAFHRARRLRFGIGDAEATTIIVEREARDYETRPLQVPAGLTFVDLTSLDGSESAAPDPRRLSVAFFRVVLESR